MSLSDKVAIVTGADDAIGAAIAVGFDVEDASIALVGTNEGRLAEVAAKCKDSLIIKADVSNDDDVKRIVQATLDRFGKINVLVNNTGTVKCGSITDGTILDTYDEVMNTNLRAAVVLTALATPHLIATKGNIINISGLCGTSTPKPPFHAYCMSKAALNHFTKGAALELAPSGVRVNAISPGSVRKDITEKENAELPSRDWIFPTNWEALGRVTDPEEVADIAGYLADIPGYLADIE